MNVAIYGSGEFGRKMLKRFSSCEGINVTSFIETVSTKEQVDEIKNIDLEKFIVLGCDRIGTSRAVGLCKGMETSGY